MESEIEVVKDCAQEQKQRYDRNMEQFKRLIYRQKKEDDNEFETL